MALAARTSMTSARITGWSATLLAAGALAAAILAPAHLQLPGAVALALMSIACMTRACTRRWPSALGLIADAAVLALAGMARDPNLPVWSIPQSWGGLLHLSGAGFVAFLLLYLVASVASCLGAHAHLRWRESLVLLAMAAQANLAFMLAAEAPMLSLGQMAGLHDAPAAMTGRAISLAILALSICASCGILLRGRPSRDARLYGLLALIGLLTSVTPLIANLPTMLGHLPVGLAAVLGAVTAAAAQAGLWSLVFLLTGMAMDALQGRPPTFEAAREHARKGAVNGAYYGGLFMALLLSIALFLRVEVFVDLLKAAPAACALVLGPLLFPLALTIITSADDLPPFFGRLKRAYANLPSYGRGLVIGVGVAAAAVGDLPAASPLMRFLATFALGAMAFAGVDILHDVIRILRGDRMHLQSGRIYLIGVVLGGLVGGALGWYFDTRQLGVVIAKFWAYADTDYADSGRAITTYGVNALFSKWGAFDLGNVTGGVRLFYAESLSGVMTWAIAAPLFSINFFLLQALAERRVAPLRQLFSPRGIEGLVEQTVRVLRWGLWMAPVIYSFLRLSPDPTWYNQDGAIRTLLATGAQIALPEQDFRLWSLLAFTGLLAYDWLRVLIWIDHMGLRVATLVNLSFIGGDALDGWASRYAGHTVRAGVIPDGIRRFATWAPLVIPFYIPREQSWDTAWKLSQEMQQAGGPMPFPVIQVTSAYAAAGAFVVVLIAFLARRMARPRGEHLLPAIAPDCVVADGRHILSNGLLRTEVWPDGRGFTHVHAILRHAGAIDLSRRPRDPLHLRGQFFYLHDLGQEAEAWSIGYEPMQRVGEDYAFDMPRPDRGCISHRFNGIRASVETFLDEDRPIELRRITITNSTRETRRLALTSYTELALNDPGVYLRDGDFSSMHVETWFAGPLQTIFARNRLLRGPGTDKTRRMSSEMAFQTIRITRGSARLTAYEDSRTRFIGFGSLREPHGLTQGGMRDIADEGLLATFDPASAFRVEMELAASESCEITLYTGHSPDMATATRAAARCLAVQPIPQDRLAALMSLQRQIRSPMAEGEEPPFRFSSDGSAMRVAPVTPRPWAHVLANPLGNGLMLTNRGSVYSFAGNARHNGVTSWSIDPSASVLEGQVVYVRDLDSGLSTTLGADPIRNGDNVHAVFAPGKAELGKQFAGLDLSMTLFVPHDLPADLRLLTIRNPGETTRRLRIGAYFDLALDESPFESLGLLNVDVEGDVVLASHPRNHFVKGTAFVVTNLPTPQIEIVRNRFIGEPNRDLANPSMMETGAADLSVHDDERRIAGFTGDVELAGGETRRFVIALGQRSDADEARALAQRLRDVDVAQSLLVETESWWSKLVSGPRIASGEAGFDRLVSPWLPSQILSARLWGRVGPNQRSGGIGYRDQLQDVMPLVFHEPKLVRQQILLHAAQQFPEGDVLKWWHPAHHGGTGIGLRTKATDPHLWLPHVLCHYLRATGDAAILDERIPYIEGIAVPPGEAGALLAPRPSRDDDTLYGHCLRGIGWSLDRLGAHGLALFGSGDWNDGIDTAGLDGRGESVWLTFFLHRVLIDFIPVAEARGEEHVADELRSSAERLAAATDRAWQKDHYILGFDDDGLAITNVCVMTSAWPILSGAVSYDRGLKALEAGLAALEKPDRILLLTPPFDETSMPYPGRIADYPPGVRENGGQYSHGATWVVDAWLQLSDMAHLRGDMSAAQAHADRAMACWRKISPLDKMEGTALWTYGLAPNQQPADIYDGAGHDGRGGWSLYTGSAARMLSTAYALAGVDLQSGKLSARHRPFSRASGISFDVRDGAGKRLT